MNVAISIDYDYDYYGYGEYPGGYSDPYYDDYYRYDDFFYPPDFSHGGPPSMGGPRYKPMPVGIGRPPRRAYPKF